MSALDILVINYHCASDTARTIAQMGPRPDWHIWVLDNSDSDIEWQRLQTELGTLHGLNLHCEQAPSNLGFAKACNYLFAKTKAPYCLLLNPDATIDAHAIETLLKTLMEDPKRAAVAPSMRWLPDEPWWISSAQSQHWWPIVSLRVASIMPALFRHTWQRYYREQIRMASAKHFISQSFVSGAILLMHRSAIRATSPVSPVSPVSSIRTNDPSSALIFDEQFFMYFEDADLSVRLLRAGYTIGICPQAIASHAYQHTTHKNMLMHASEAHFAKKWFPPLLRSILLRVKQMRPPAYLFAPPPTRLASASELTALLDGQTLIAISPSPWRIPAIWRSIDQDDAIGLSARAWDALSLGIYYGVVCDSTRGQPVYRFMSFEKAKSAR